MPEYTEKYNADTRYNRLIHRCCASLDLEAVFKEIKISQNIEKEVCVQCQLETCKCPAFTPGTPCSSVSSTPTSISDEQVPELVANKPLQDPQPHVQAPSDKEADREVAAICWAPEYYRVRSHVRRRRRYFFYNALDDIGETTDDDSVDYSPPRQQPLEPQVQVQNKIHSPSDSDEQSNTTPGSVTDSSLDTSSIEVIQPNEGLEIRLPIDPPQRAPPNTPEIPTTNVAVPVPDNLLTEDEDTGDQPVQPTVTSTSPDQKGRQETLSPTPNVLQSVRSAIEITVEDFKPSDLRIIDKCGEVDFQLSNHQDWSKPNSRLCKDICDLLPILYQSRFNTEVFPNLEDYLYQTVGSLPCQLLLRLALDSVFEEFPEISAIQTKVYLMLRCHLSIINHSFITQFHDISLSNHDFDRVAGADFHSISGAESRPDLSLQTDFNEMYYSVFSQAQRQVHRVTKRSVGRLHRDRANSCPDIVQLNRDVDDLSNSNWRYTTAHERLDPYPHYLKDDKQTQTEFLFTSHLRHTGAQYSSPSDSSDSSTSDSDSDIEGTENITVTKRCLHRHSVSSEDLYTNPKSPNTRFRTSTPDPIERQPEKEPIWCPLREIITHRPALQIPSVDLIVAPGRQATNAQRGIQ